MSRGIGPQQLAILAAVDAAGGRIAVRALPGGRNRRRLLAGLVRRGLAQHRRGGDGHWYVSRANASEYLSEESGAVAGVSHGCLSSPEDDNTLMDPIAIRMPRGLLARADEIAKALGQRGVQPTRAALLRTAVERGLAVIARSAAAPVEIAPTHIPADRCGS